MGSHSSSRVIAGAGQRRNVNVPDASSAILCGVSVSIPTCRAHPGSSLDSSSVQEGTVMLVSLDEVAEMALDSELLVLAPETTRGV